MMNVIRRRNFILLFIISIVDEKGMVVKPRKKGLDKSLNSC